MIDYYPHFLRFMTDLLEKEAIFILDKDKNSKEYIIRILSNGGIKNYAGDSIDDCIVKVMNNDFYSEYKV